MEVKNYTKQVFLDKLFRKFEKIVKSEYFEIIEKRFVVMDGITD